MVCSSFVSNVVKVSRFAVYLLDYVEKPD